MRKSLTPRDKVSTGSPEGFGSFWERKPGYYTKAEFFSQQVHPDRFRPADFCLRDKEERQYESDDSLLYSDWVFRTSLDNDDFQKEDRNLGPKSIDLHRGFFKDHIEKVIPSGKKVHSKEAIFGGT